MAGSGYVALWRARAVQSRCACLYRVPAGPEFEKRILANERNNAKFNFLVTTDPYHAYYKMRVRDLSAAAPPQRADTAQLHRAGAAG